MNSFHVKIVFTANNWGIQGYTLDAVDAASTKEQALSLCKDFHGDRKISKVEVSVS